MLGFAVSFMFSALILCTVGLWSEKPEGIIFRAMA